MINRLRVRQHFSKAADTYDEAAVVQRRTAEDMAERTLLLTSDKHSILELGCGTGLLTEQLSQHYPQADIYAVDLADNMLQQAKARLMAKPPSWQFWSRKTLPVKLIQADAFSLPFADAAFDLVVSNFMLQWCQDLDAVFAEVRRVTKPGGALLFSTFGPDTLKELRQAWLAVEGDAAHQRFNDFIDMHDIGDALIRSGFGQPVMDVEQVRIVYKSAMGVMRDLKAMGATNAKSVNAPKGLLRRDTLKAVEAFYEAQSSIKHQVTATYEVVQGHAWAAQEIMKGPNRDKSGVINITLDELSVQLKNSRNNN